MKLPTAQAIVAKLRALLGRDVTAGRAVPGALSKPAIVATFHGDSEGITCLCLCDLAFAARVAAALALFPASRAADAIRTGSLGEDLQDCFHEVMNVLGPLLTEHLGEHTVLQSVYESQAGIPEDVKGRLGARAPWRIELQVDVKGYGNGTLALLGVAREASRCSPLEETIAVR